MIDLDILAWDELILRGCTQNISGQLGERGKARSKRSGQNEEFMAIAMGDEEDRSGEAAAGRLTGNVLSTPPRENGLQVPHPELMNRPFLVSQMASLRADWRYPVPGFAYSHLTLAEIIHAHVPFDPGGAKCFIPFPQMVGIVNVTPDSFSDGGRYFHAEKAIERIQELMAHGAAVIDIGAQSTRLGATPISFEEEWNLLEPVLDC